MTQAFNMDCMDAMAGMMDNYFDLAIVDPPYFSGPEKRGYYGQSKSTIGVKRVNYIKTETWQLPDKSYYDELVRVSRNRIIWGINYFDFIAAPGRIVWDKCNPGTTFSDCELASCSLHDSVRMFRYMWNGMLQGESIAHGQTMQGNKKLNEKRIHPTQKPVNLYKWLLKTYAQKGDTILDTHLGSGSSRIAAHDMGFDFVGYEKDGTHFEAQELRFKHHVQQQSIFQPKEMY